MINGFRAEKQPPAHSQTQTNCVVKLNQEAMASSNNLLRRVQLEGQGNPQTLQDHGLSRMPNPESPGLRVGSFWLSVGFLSGSSRAEPESRSPNSECLPGIPNAYPEPGLRVTVRCRANTAPIRQSRQDFGLVFQAKVLKTFQNFVCSEAVVGCRARALVRCEIQKYLAHQRQPPPP